MNMDDINVLKRNGQTEKFNPEKIHKVLEWAINGYTGVSVSEIEINAKLKFRDGISTKEVHRTLIDSARDLISLESPNYQYVAARLLLYMIRKDVWGSHEEPSFFDHISKMVEGDYYDSAILEDYDLDEIKLCEEKIDHDRDYNFTFAGLQQKCDKYLVQDRITKQLFETPQLAYMVIAMSLFRNYDKKTRLQYVFKCYDYISKFKISLPTPILAGVRTPLRRYASCCLIDVDDNLNSLGASNDAVLRYTASRSGIGLNMGRIRGINSSIRNGEVVHTGVIPFLKWYESCVKSCQQNGIRGGSATVHFPFWHKEIEDIITLKNNAKTGDNSVRGLDYSIGFSRLFYTRFLESMKTDKDIMISLFSPNDVPDLYDVWGYNDKFDTLYEKYENNKKIPKRQIPVKDLMKLFTKERRETARIYATNIDHINEHSSFLEQITMSNLCVTGDQRVVSDRGMLTVEELYEQGGNIKLFDNEKVVESSPMKLIERGADVYKITLENGLTHTITDYHKVLTLEKDSRNRDNKVMKACSDLKIGDRVSVQTNKGLFGDDSSRFSGPAFLLGLYQSDGTQYKDRIAIDVWEKDFDLLDEIQEHFNTMHNLSGCGEITVINQTGVVGTRSIPPAKFNDCKVSYSDVKKKRLMSKTFKKAFNFEKGYIPNWIWEASEKTQWQYVRGLLYADGSAHLSKSNGNPLYISYTDINKDFLEELQLLFLNLGINAAIHDGEDEYKSFHSGQKEYYCKPVWRLIIGNKNDGLVIEKNTGFLSRKGIKLEDRTYRDNTKKAHKVKSIEYVGKEDVYCVTVDSDEHLWTCNGIITSNCQEITQPTKPLQHIDDPEGEIGICILSAINVLEIKSDTELRKVCDITVRLLDELIDHQTYPVKAAENFTKKRRSLGIGITNLAALFAKNGLRYDELSSDAPNFVDELMEKIQYNLILASCNLAKERGPCEKFNKTSYAEGIFPIDTYNKNMDTVVTRKPSQDWDTLRKLVAKYGMRNSTVSSMMPCESSSVVSNSTNGIEPIKKFFIVKSSKSGKLPFIVPSYTHWKNKYTLQFNMKNNIGYSNITGAIQKWTDMAISCMHYYNYDHYEDNKLPDNKLIQEFLYHYKMGNKTLYYTYSNDLDKQSIRNDETPEINPLLSLTDTDIHDGCAGGACAI